MFFCFPTKIPQDCSRYCTPWAWVDCYRPGGHSKASKWAVVVSWMSVVLSFITRSYQNQKFYYQSQLHGIILDTKLHFIQTCQDDPVFHRMARCFLTLRRWIWNETCPELGLESERLIYSHKLWVHARLMFVADTAHHPEIQNTLQETKKCCRYISSMSHAFVTSEIQLWANHATRLWYEASTWDCQTRVMCICIIVLP